jgi:hypothetical protein
MPSRVSVLVIAAIVLLAACGHSSPPIAPEPTYLEYQVLSAYLSQQAKVHVPEGQILAIASWTTTITGDPQRRLAASYVADPELKTYDEAVRSLLDTNLRASTFNRSFVPSSGIQYQIFEPTKMPSVTQPQPPTGRSSNSSRPSTLIHFSRVGFNRDQTQALFLVSFICGNRCGSGALVLMQKDSHSDWQFQRELQRWVS